MSAKRVERRVPCQALSASFCEELAGNRLGDGTFLQCRVRHVPGGEQLTIKRRQYQAPSRHGGRAVRSYAVCTLL